MKLFEDLPSTNRPITAENLNQMQDNLVVVSPTEPTGDNREKVWIQKGKNLFDKSSRKILNGYLSVEGVLYCDPSDNINKSCYITCSPYTIYTISKIAGKRFRVGVSSVKPTHKLKMTNVISNDTGTKITITSNATDKYLVIYYIDTSKDTLTEQEIIDSLQIEQGSTATEYGEYIEPKIYVKNDNDVYEEFIKRQEDNYSLNEIKTNKTWTDGKPIYRKVITFTPTEVAGSQSYDVSNVENIVNLEGFMRYNDDNVLPLTFSFYQNSTTYYSFFRASASKGVIKYDMSELYINKPVSVVIEYTKTTD